MNASEVTELLQHIDTCDLSPRQRDVVKRAVLTYTAGSISGIVAIEREAVLDIVRRHIHSSHFMRVRAKVEEDAARRGVA